MRKLTVRKSFATLMVALLVGICSPAMVPRQQVMAATYTQGNQSLSIVDGMATLTVNGTETYQLTKSLVTKDGGIDSNGTVWLLWMSNSLYWYNYQYQKPSTDLHLAAKGVLSLTTDASGAVTGYDTSAGHYNVLSLDEIRAQLGQQQTQTNTQQQQTQTNTQQQQTQTNTQQQTTQTANQVSQLGNTVVYTDSTGKMYILSEGKVVDKAVGFEGIAMIRYTDGSIKYWVYDLQKGELTPVLKELAASSNGLVVDSSGKPYGYVASNGQFVSFSKESLWIMAQTQPQQTATVPTTSTTQQAASSTGWSTGSTSTSGTYKQFYSVSSGVVKKALEDSSGVQQECLKFWKKQGKVLYEGRTFVGVKFASFNTNGNVVMWYKNGRTVVVKRGEPDKYKLVSSSTKKITTVRGLAAKVIQKDGSKKSLSKF